MKQLQYIWKTSALKIYNSKVATFALVIIVTCWSYNRPLNMFIDSVNYPVSWCIFPFLMSSFPFLILFWFGIIYINSDVPFMQHINMYQILRTGRKRWAVGQVGGIFLRSFATVFFTVVCTILPLLPRIELTNEWGKLLKTAAMTNAMSVYQFKYVVYYEIFSEYTPLQLVGICFLLCVLIATFIGTFMFLISLYSSKVLSVAGAMAMAILLFFVINMHPKIRQKLAFFVPTVWAEVARIASPEHGYYWLPSISYMLAFLIIGIGFMTALIVHKVKRVEFNWENEDV